MYYRSLISFSCLIGAGLPLCGPAHATDDAATICKGSMGAYGEAATSGDAVKMAAVFAPDGELISPYGIVSGHDALVKNYASFMKSVGGVALCTGGYTFTPASGGSGEKGFWTKVAGKVGGEWKILNLTYAPAAPQ
jgi:hypothetical protein